MYIVYSLFMYPIITNIIFFHFYFRGNTNASGILTKISKTRPETYVIVDIYLVILLNI